MEPRFARFTRIAPRFILALALFARTEAKARIDRLTDGFVEALDALPEYPTPQQIASVVPVLAAGVIASVQDIAVLICDAAPKIEDNPRTHALRETASLILPPLMTIASGAFARLEAVEATPNDDAPAYDPAALLGALLEGVDLEEFATLMRAFDIDNDDDEPAEAEPEALPARDALGILDGNPQAVRMYLAAQLQDAGIDPDDLFDGEGLSDVELTPLLHCTDEDDLIEMVDELRAELRVAL